MNDGLSDAGRSTRPYRNPIKCRSSPSNELSIFLSAHTTSVPFQFRRVNPSFILDIYIDKLPIVASWTIVKFI